MSEELEELEQEVQEEVQEWAPDDETPDPMAELRSEIAQLRESLKQKDDPTFEDELVEKISKKVGSTFAPIIEQMQAPNEVRKIVNIVGKGLGDEAKSHIEDYLSSYTASQLEYIRVKDKRTLETLRLAAEGIEARGKKLSKSAPRSEVGFWEIW